VSGLNIFLETILLVAMLLMCGLAVTTSVKVFRLRNKRLSWRAGKLAGFPLFSTIFLGISIILVVTMAKYGNNLELAASGFYLVISCAWFITSYFSSKGYITDHGIVKNVNDPAQTVAWHQICDFFECPVGDHNKFIFIYREEDIFAITMVRLQLTVPTKKEDAFKKIISHKLGRRISCFDEESIDINELINS
jgi:hypothetical protein